MARLIGYMANRADRLRDAFHQERHAVAGFPADQRGAWGLGFYQGDEVLHKKQPTPDGEPIHWETIAANVKTDCAVAHLRQATVGGFSVDNTHPFRFRQWLFAHVGTITGFDEVRSKLLAELPDFLGRNIRGNSDSELFFHLILARLHQQSQLEAALPTNPIMLEAVSSALRTIDDMVGSAREQSTLNMVLCNGRTMYALRRGGTFGYVERQGLHDPLEAQEQTPPRPGSPSVHYVMLVSGGHDVPDGYTALGEAQLGILNRDLVVQTHAL
jgi:predicted glutamine amidotransferase